MTSDEHKIPFTFISLNVNITKLTSLWAGVRFEMLVKWGSMLYNAVNRLPAFRPSNDCRRGDFRLIVSSIWQYGKENVSSEFFILVVMVPIVVS